MNRADIKVELQETGKWDEYLALREKLKDEGVTPKEAAVRAYEQIGKVQPVQRPGVSKAPKTCPYAELSLAAPKGSCAEREAAAFVFEFAAVPVERIPGSVVPSKGAVGLLKWVQTSPSNAATFYSSIWAKLMPSRTQLDAEARFSDDGKGELEIISRLEETFEPEEKPVQVQNVPEGAAGESIPMEQEAKR